MFLVQLSMDHGTMATVGAGSHTPTLPPHDPPPTWTRGGGREPGLRTLYARRVLASLLFSFYSSFAPLPGLSTPFPWNKGLRRPALQWGHRITGRDETGILTWAPKSLDTEPPREGRTSYEPSSVAKFSLTKLKFPGEFRNVSLPSFRIISFSKFYLNC